MVLKGILGTVLLWLVSFYLPWNLNATDPLADRTNPFFTGCYTGETAWNLLVGIASVVGGMAIIEIDSRKANTWPRLFNSDN